MHVLFLNSGLHPKVFYFVIDVLFHLLCAAASGNPVSSQHVGTTNSAKVIQPMDFSDTPNMTLQRQGSVTETPDRLNGLVPSKSYTVPKVVSRDSPDGKDSSRRESITFSRTKPGMLLRPAHSRRPSSTKYDVDRLSACAESGELSSAKSNSESLVDSFSKIKVAPEDGARDGREDNHSTIKNVSAETEKVLPPQTPKTEKCKQFFLNIDGSLVHLHNSA